MDRHTHWMIHQRSHAHTIDTVCVCVCVCVHVCVRARIRACSTLVLVVICNECVMTHSLHTTHSFHSLLIHWVRNEAYNSFVSFITHSLSHEWGIQLILFINYSFIESRMRHTTHSFHSILIHWVTNEAYNAFFSFITHSLSHEWAFNSWMRQRMRQW